MPTLHVLLYVVLYKTRPSEPRGPAHQTVFMVIGTFTNYKKAADTPLSDPAHTL
jgi:hypothetical protein